MKSSSSKKIFPDKAPYPCVSLVGMAGAGKSTIGALLAREMGWAWLDSDHLIEAMYGARLQDITEAMDREAFLDMECGIICALRQNKCVIATGGSVVYRQEAIKHLASLGPVVHVDLPIEQVIERIARKPDRGLVIGPGESLADLYAQRRPLYEKAASFSVDSGVNDPDQCVRIICENLAQNFDKRFFGRQCRGN